MTLSGLPLRHVMMRTPVKYVDIPAFWDFDPENFDLKPVDFISLLEAAVKRADGAKVYPKGHPKEGQPLSTADATREQLAGSCSG